MIISFSDCFEWNEDHTNVTGNSNSTLNFYDQVSKFDMCISNAKKDNENVCIKCNDTYDQLNQFYDNLSITKLDKICFDIQDKVKYNLKLLYYKVLTIVKCLFRLIKQELIGLLSRCVARINDHPQQLS